MQSSGVVDLHIIRSADNVTAVRFAVGSRGINILYALLRWCLIIMNQWRIKMNNRAHQRVKLPKVDFANWYKYNLKLFDTLSESRTAFPALLVVILLGFIGSDYITSCFTTSTCTGRENVRFDYRNVRLIIASLKLITFYYNFQYFDN